MISLDLQEKLIVLAIKAQEKAYAPYSKFPVGAALITEEGDFFTGCNVENISFGLSNCGERTAIFSMIAEKGANAKIKAMAVTTQASIPCSPCGVCRQVIYEFSTPETLVIYKGPDGFVTFPITHLLPEAFSKIA